MGNYTLTGILGVESLGEAVRNYLLFNLVPAFLFLVAGFLVGKFVGEVLRRALVKLKIDAYFARDGRVRFRMSEFLSMVTKWGIYLLAVWFAVDQLQVQPLSQLLEKIVLEFLPGIIKAILIIVCGYFIAEYVKERVEEIGVVYSDVVSAAVFWLIVYIAVAMALPLVGIPATLVNNILLITLASLGGGFAIAIGLGLKDVISEMAREHLKAMKRKRKVRG